MGVRLEMYNKFLLVLLAVATLNGCAAVRAFDSAEEQVRVRAQERVDFLINKNLKGAYEYATPALRDLETIQQYHSRVGGAALWTKAVVQKVVCEEDACDVDVEVTYRILRLGSIEMTRIIQERWVKSKNNWWIYHQL